MAGLLERFSVLLEESQKIGRDIEKAVFSYDHKELRIISSRVFDLAKKIDRLNYAMGVASICSAVCDDEEEDD